MFNIFTEKHNNNQLKLYFRTYINKIRVIHFSGITIEKKQWDLKKEKIINHPAQFEINHFIDKKIQELYQFESLVKSENKPFLQADFKSVFKKITCQLHFTVSKIAGLLVIVGGLIVSAINHDSSIAEISIISGCGLIGIKTFVSRKSKEGTNGEG